MEESVRLLLLFLKKIVRIQIPAFAAVFMSAKDIGRWVSAKHLQAMIIAVANGSMLKTIPAIIYAEGMAVVMVLAANVQPILTALMEILALKILVPSEYVITIQGLG